MYKSKQFYTALIQRNPKYIGIFYACIKSTSIFCISTCRAKKPKYENTLFVNSVSEAIENGYRACKICKPTEKGDFVPADIQYLLSKLDSKEKISDSSLLEFGLRPEYVRRWFKKRYNITFHAYQRIYRIGRSIDELKNGKSVQDSAYDNGYESISGFAYLLKNNTSISPSKVKKENTILFTTWNSPLGEMIICSSNNGICLLEFLDRKSLETEIKGIQIKFNSILVFGNNDHINSLKDELSHYFNGTNLEFKVPIDFKGSDFQERVWKNLMDIPFGKTITYSKLASKINCINGSRAVANANGANKISILIPCHRVVGSDGNLTGYGGGLKRKEWLLNHEKNAAKTLKAER